MPDNFYRPVTSLLKDHGWSFHRNAKGSHEVWVGPDGRKVTVPRSLKRRSTANAILKQAKIDAKI